jgi:hypothetical protein
MTPSKPTRDEAAGMAWWNALTVEQRHAKLAYVQDLKLPPTVAQAWTIEQRDRVAVADELDESVWRAGFVSGNLHRAEVCPYPNGSIQSLSWTSGRIEGADKPRGTLPPLCSIKKPQP